MKPAFNSALNFQHVTQAWNEEVPGAISYTPSQRPLSGPDPKAVDEAAAVLLEFITTKDKVYSTFQSGYSGT